MNLSKRAAKLVRSPSPIVLGHTKCAEDPYGLGNPKGHLNFGTAENHLVDDLLLPKLNIQLEHSPEDIQYNKLFGTDEFRISLSHFLQKYLELHQLNPNNIVIQPGVSAVCESLSFCMFDEGDYLILPSPYYTGFDHDFTKRFKVKFLKAHLDAKSSFKHDIKAFEKAYQDCHEKDKIKAVLLTDPHNPTGEVLSDKFKDEIIHFCKDKNLSIISDEIYALSYLNSKRHSSLYGKAQKEGIDAHLLYGFAKDFALAGMKVGVYYSENHTIIQAMQDLSYFHPVNTTTQRLLANIIEDDAFLGHYIKENQKRLKTLPLIISDQLKEFKFIMPEAGLFMLLDLSDHIKSLEQERGFFNLLLDKYKINISPGETLGLETPGFYRVCFAQKKESVLEFIVRMKEFYQHELK